MAINDSGTTLGDLNRLDRDNFDHIMKRDGQIYKFATYKQAVMFMGQCVDKVMRKCGVKIRPGMDENRINRLMKSREVKVEQRTYDIEVESKRADSQGGTPYQSGLYIYSRQEIAGFVSSPFQVQSEIDLIPAFYIKTTGKMGGL